MDLIWYFCLFLFGCFLGSFLNVLVDRIPEGKSIVWSRSQCDHCGKTLQVLDLVPVLSFVFLRGKCRYCHHRLSYYYPVAEVTTGLLFLLVSIVLFGSRPLLLFEDVSYVIVFLYYLFISSSLLVLFFTDLKYGIIPFRIVFPSLFVSLLWHVYFFFFTSGKLALVTSIIGSVSLVNYIFSALGIFFFFLLLFVGTKGRGLGFGDVVYVAFMGLILGFPKILFGVYAAFLTGALVSLILVLLRRKKFSGGTIPFGPFLVFGTFLSWFWGDWFIRMVMGYLLHI